MTQQQAENATKWLQTIHLNEKESFLCNRLKKITHHRIRVSVFFLTHKFSNYDKATERKSRKMVTHQKL